MLASVSTPSKWRAQQLRGAVINTLSQGEKTSGGWRSWERKRAEGAPKALRNPSFFVSRGAITSTLFFLLLHQTQMCGTEEQTASCCRSTSVWLHWPPDFLMLLP